MPNNLELKATVDHEEGRAEKRNTDIVTKDLSDASGSEPNCRIDHRVLMAKQTGYGSTPARDYMEHMLEEEEEEECIEDNMTAYSAIIVIIVPVAFIVPLAFMFL